ncbi:P-loop containing nucleoside triphosphate hydrolase protein [Mycena rosella]|uniref:P-loop containing nucleoside triphosphate hydrolase protein n=1 Tax=Mycena rosella TaxID=1033263 RepID=A0AAD7D4F3_MYCRO|nr:P-loop containing nucleoside triphosphate hydrolase protein [Mycena rosella]
MDEWHTILIGVDGVGRTALAVQFAFDFFVTGYNSTLDACYRKQLVVDDAVCFVDVLDQAGEDITDASLREQFIRRGQGFFLVYSVTSRSSFSRLEELWQWLQRIRGENTPFMLLGNKCDFGASDRAVSTEEGAALARQFGCPFLEVSAKTGMNVERAFSDLVRLLRQNRPDATAPQESSQRKGKRKGKCIVF